MARVSRDSAPEVVDYGPAEDRNRPLRRVHRQLHLDPGGLRPRAFLKGLPGDSCQCPHWGYMMPAG